MSLRGQAPLVQLRRRHLLRLPLYHLLVSAATLGHPEGIMKVISAGQCSPGLSLAAIAMTIRTVSQLTPATANL